jgi:C-terminal, D2-small domain, of ClpB protein
VLGARPLRRTIQRAIEDALSEKILYGELKAGQIVTVDAEGTGPQAQLTFEGVPKPGEVPDTPPPPPRSTPRRPPAGPTGTWPPASNTTRAGAKQPRPGRSAVTDTTSAWAASYRGT